MRRARDGERGQAEVEFALVSTALFLLILGIVEISLGLFVYDSVANAARIGTRWAMVRGTSCITAECPATVASVKTYVISKSAGLNAASLVVTTTWSTAAGCTSPTFQGSGCLVTVLVQYPIKLAYPIARTVTISSTSQMVMSQ